TRPNRHCPLQVPHSWRHRHNRPDKPQTRSAIELSPLHSGIRRVLKPRGSTLMIPVVKLAESAAEIGPDVGQASLPGSPIRQTDSNGIPRLTIARGKSSLRLQPQSLGARDSAELRKQSLRWYDYGIGLFEQAQYGPASDAFRRAASIDPNNPAPLVSAAISELKTERYGTERDQLEKASMLLEQALTLDPDNPRGRLYKAIVLRSQGKARNAVEILACLARE